MPNQAMLKKLEELFESGNTPEVSQLVGELLAQSAADTGSLRRLSLTLASMACAEADLDKRMPVITALAGLTEKQQPFHMEYCRDRENMVTKLAEAGKWPELLSLLRSSLLRWQPDTESQTNLVWLTKCFMSAKENCRSLKAELNLKLPGGGTFQTGSHSYMSILIAETLAAGAAAWHRCLRGPGGVNFCLDNLWIFAADEFTDEFISILAQDPVAYVALINEAAEKQINEELGSILQPDNLLQGVRASEYCLTTLLKKVREQA